MEDGDKVYGLRASVFEWLGCQVLPPRFIYEYYERNYSRVAKVATSAAKGLCHVGHGWVPGRSATSHSATVPSYRKQDWYKRYAVL